MLGAEEEKESNITYEGMSLLKCNPYFQEIIQRTFKRDDIHLPSKRQPTGNVGGCKETEESKVKCQSRVREEWYVQASRPGLTKA